MNAALIPAALLRRLEVEQFLAAEAECLDEWRLRDWLALLTDDVVYQVPIRIHKEVTGASRVTGVLADSFHMDEDRTSLEMRVERIETGFAWAEEPPTRTRHLVATVRVGDPDQDGALPVRSNLLLYHTRWDRPEYTILSAERRDPVHQARHHHPAGPVGAGEPDVAGHRHVLRAAEGPLRPRGGPAPGAQRAHGRPPGGDVRGRAARLTTVVTAWPA